jgi:hydroxymethylpyrimidine kinase/phosphomethylpyrimidine kinase
MTPPTVLTIGGSDCAGSRGIQGDLKTFAAHHAYGMAVITCVQSHSRQGINDVYPVPSTVVAAQLTAVLDQSPPAATKVGMLATAEIASAVIARARAGRLPNLVVDPVLTSADGRRRGVSSAVERLLPYALVVTPNVEEASALLGWDVVTPTDMAGAASQLASNGPKYVVVTGGQMPGSIESVDAVWTDAGARFMRSPRIDTPHRVGVGDAFAAALTARLAIGCPVPEALSAAKNYATRGLQGGRRWHLHPVAGPIDHFGWAAEELFAR